MDHFFYRLRAGPLRFARFEQKIAATGSTWAAMAMSLAGFLCGYALLIRPKNEKDCVDPSSLPAPNNSLAVMYTRWCRSGASGCGLLAVVYHSSTAPETSRAPRYSSPVVASHLSGSLGASLFEVRLSESKRTSPDLPPSPRG